MYNISCMDGFMVYNIKGPKEEEQEQESIYKPTKTQNKENNILKPNMEIVFHIHKRISFILLKRSSKV